MKNNRWYQFSVWKEDHPDKFPEGSFEYLRALYNSAKEHIERWHYLFEPYILVRFQSPGQYKATEEAKVHVYARELAEYMGFKFAHGDVNSSSPSGRSGPSFYGEHRFYDSDELWQANADLLDANARIGLILGDNPEAFKRFSGKIIHLVCNQFGLDYKQESKLLYERGRRSKELYKKYGSQ